MALVLKGPPEGRYVHYVRGFDRVWFCRGIDIARHWRDVHPYAARS